MALKRSYLKRKTPINKTPKVAPLPGLKTHYTGSWRHSKLRLKSRNPVAVAKEKIQSHLRTIVIHRDGGCVLRNLQHKSCACGGYAKDGHLILQADHLITRSNSATYAEPRLVVAVCKSHHAWKSLGGNARKKWYDELVYKILPKDRQHLWDIAELDSRRSQTRVYESEWLVIERHLAQQALLLTKNNGTTKTNT